MIESTPTKRAMIDVGRKCNINCRFCYYRHLGDLTKQTFESIDKLKMEVDMAHARGNDYIDISGGEPTIYPEICELVKHAKSKNMGVCIITNALVGENQTQKLIDAGVDDFLVSIHGMTKTHNWLVCQEDARMKQMNFINSLKNKKISFRFNVVINQYNQNELIDLITEYRDIGAYIWNFINFNPHHDWINDIDGTKNIISDLIIVEEQFNRIIPELEDKGIGVNLRYYPMCRIKEEYRRCICNDFHVSFDPYEWDYHIIPKTLDAHLRWGITGSKSVELKEYPCSTCKIKNICGGINRYYYAAIQDSDKEILKPVKEFDGDEYDFYFYRQHNELTLKRRT